MASTESTLTMAMTLLDTCQKTRIVSEKEPNDTISRSHVALTSKLSN